MRRERFLRACVLALGSSAVLAAAFALQDRTASSVPATAAVVRVTPAAGERATAADVEERLVMVREAASRRRQQAAIEAAAVAEAARRVWPAAGARTGWFGEARRRHIHPGMDLDGETGDPIWAAALGTVVHAGQAPKGYSGYGLLVLLDHGGGVQTLYAHLSRVDVAVGQRLRAGDTLGAMGTTGNVTGSHLHFEVRVDGRTIDPEDWLPAR